MIIVMFTIPMEKTKIIMMVQFPWIIIILVFSMGIVNSTMIMGFPMGIVRIEMILVFPWELLVTNRDGTYKSLEPKF